MHIYCTLSIISVNTYKIYAPGYGVRDAQQYRTGEILRDKSLFDVEVKQESHKKICFGAKVYEHNLLQSIELDFGNCMAGYSV